MITTKVKPISGFYSGSWVNGEGQVTVMFVDANTIKIYNEGITNIPAGNVRVIILR